MLFVSLDFLYLGFCLLRDCCGWNARVFFCLRRGKMADDLFMTAARNWIGSAVQNAVEHTPTTHVLLIGFIAVFVLLPLLSYTTKFLLRCLTLVFELACGAIFVLGIAVAVQRAFPSIEWPFVSTPAE